MKKVKGEGEWGLSEIGISFKREMKWWRIGINGGNIEYLEYEEEYIFYIKEG